MSLTVLAYNIKRMIGLLGVGRCLKQFEPEDQQNCGTQQFIASTALPQLAPFYRVST
jgi:hypothetical protein